MYTVVVLVEQVMSANDAQEVVSLHDAIEDSRHYHILIPCENAAARVETALGALAASEVLAAPPVLNDDLDVEKAQEDIDHSAETSVTASVAAIQALGHGASGEFSSEDPIETLGQVVSSHNANEVIVMTRPHVIQEFLHIDWASKARRRLGVPIL
ncbi:MAG: hypothetical protein ACRDP4_04710, partial [Nocardioidaceae bacterium]